ncbi:CTL-like protein 1 [Zootermopsis nevadensis]|uniref:Choline transporter-like protein n=1 Tax=Zootermopsis nevadensis TaxID=136037 RepID=A0A067RBG8_ZOONE|nr:CTL-like protein 1 [Zootermopsis nevadensis]XP_021916822.1 CTL-like protein 1 [Zootermopsis nevadensis]XP_021916823.1 CTL-like protein 1 [Zootermopsis nevadensis]KDR21092.1 CTL-like protein 1 [Zootermopsis nevadensis]
MSCCNSDSDTAARNEGNTTRGCTDILWLCIFILFWFVMIYIAAFAYVYGDPLKLINGYDSFGNTCGVPNNEKMGGLELSGLDTSDKRYLFYMDVKDIQNSLKICVKQCPDHNLVNFANVQEFYERTGSLLCTYGFNLNSQEWQQNSKSAVLQTKFGPCPPTPIYDSVPVLNRCVPRPVKELVFSVLNNWDTVEQVLGDLYATWREILGLTFLAFVLSIIVIAVLHLLASFVAWIFMIIVSITAVVGTGVLWWTYADLKRQLDSTPESQMLRESVKNESAFLVYSIVATIITIIILLLVIAVRKSISSMARVFEESAQCLAALPALFLQPFITFIALMVFFAFWVSVIICLATSNYPGSEFLHPLVDPSLIPDISHSQSASSAFKLSVSLSNISLSGLKRFTFFEMEPSWVRYMWWLYLIGLVWTSEFILSCQQMVIAGAVAHWMFANRNKESGSVMSSVGKLICYHLGSVAKGSFLITIFKLPRLVLSYIDRKLRKHKAAGSECASCGLRTCICCLYCLENFIKFINHNAYTVIAMEGYSFCTSAKIAFNTLVSNALDLAVLNSVGDFILFLGKCFVTAATGSIGLVIMKQNPHLHFYAVPTLIVCIFAYFIAHSVLTLYEIVIDTMFLCMCEGKKLYGNEWGEPSGKMKETNGDSSNELEPMNSMR